MKLIYTYEMVGVADENGRTYETIYGTYNREDGFKFNDSIIPIINEGGYEELINTLFHEDLWKLQKDVKNMTLEEIEKELGYPVRIVDPEPNKNEISEERREQVDSYVDFLRRFLGIDLDPEDYY